jgi:cytochrome bd-type quinol oxidase subunit 2
MIPLQLNFPDVPEWVQLLTQVGQLLTAVLGLLIAYTAYKGYRRNDSRPMFFIALGFALAIGLPVVLIVPTLLIRTEPVVTIVAVVSEAFTLVGLGCILYALRL